MQSLEYIDGYFKGEFSPKEKMEFERKLTEDPDFADDVAFYISTRQVSKDLVMEEKKNNFKRIYAEYDQEAKVIPMRRVWSFSAAAAVFAALVFGWFMFMKPPTPQQLADKYISENLTRLEIKMGASEDSIQSGIRLYNDKNFGASLLVFENILKSNPTSDKALEYAGKAALKEGNYDKSIQYFTRLEDIKLEYNPGKLYHAITLMKRNGPGDDKAAKSLLQEVVSKNLEGKEIAEKWLKYL